MKHAELYAHPFLTANTFYNQVMRWPHNELNKMCRTREQTIINCCTVIINKNHKTYTNFNLLILISAESCLLYDAINRSRKTEEGRDIGL